jgi:hypothetical protein
MNRQARHGTFSLKEKNTHAQKNDSRWGLYACNRSCRRYASSIGEAGNQLRQDVLWRSGPDLSWQSELSSCALIKTETL